MCDEGKNRRTEEGKKKISTLFIFKSLLYYQSTYRKPTKSML